MKNIKFLIILLLFLPFVIFAKSNYNDSVSYAKNYINDFPSYDKYLYAYKGELISFQEYKVTLSNKNKSYLLIDLTYWTNTEDTIVNNKRVIGRNITSLNINNTSGVRVCDYVKPKTKVNGKGTQSNPWVFVNLNKVIFSSYDEKLGNINESDKVQYVSDSAVVRLVNIANNHKYQSISCNDKNIVVSYDKNTKQVNISNITKDTQCFVKFDILCPDGYSAVDGSTSISECYIDVPDGKYLATAKSATLSNCSKGSSNAAHRVYYGYTSSCNKCISGQYQDLEGQKVCKTCPNGYSSSDVGSTSITQCYISVEGGKYIASVNSPEKTNCPIGTYSSNHIVKYGSISNCTECGYYKYQDLEGQTTCKSCPSGYYSTPRSTSINSCYVNVSANTYLKNAGDTVGTACPSGTVTIEHSVHYGNTSSCQENYCNIMTSRGYANKILVKSESTTYTNLFHEKYGSCYSSGNYVTDDWKSDSQHGSCYSGNCLDTMGFRRYMKGSKATNINSLNKACGTRCSYGPFASTEPVGTYGYISAGQNNYSYNIPSEQTAFIMIRGGGAGGKYGLSSFKLIINGNYYTLNQAAAYGYIQPLIIVDSSACNGKYYFSNALNSYYGGDAGDSNGGWASLIVIIQTISNISGFSVYSSANLSLYNGTYLAQDGYYIRYVPQSRFKILCK